MIIFLKFPSRDLRAPVRHCMTCPDDHPKVMEAESRRFELQLAQAENPQNFSDFNRRRLELRPGASPRPNRRNINDIVCCSVVQIEKFFLIQLHLKVI